MGMWGHWPNTFTARAAFYRGGSIAKQCPALTACIEIAQALNVSVAGLFY